MKTIDKDYMNCSSYKFMKAQEHAFKTRIIQDDYFHLFPLWQVSISNYPVDSVFGNKTKHNWLNISFGPVKFPDLEKGRAFSKFKLISRMAENPVPLLNFYAKHIGLPGKKATSSSIRLFGMNRLGFNPKFSRPHTQMLSYTIGQWWPQVGTRGYGPL